MYIYSTLTVSPLSGMANANSMSPNNMIAPIWCSANRPHADNWSFIFGPNSILMLF